MHRSVHSSLLAEAGHGAVPGVQLGAAPRQDVSLHGRGDVGLQTFHERHRPFHGIVWNIDAPGPAHFQNLAHRRLEHGPRLGLAAKHAEGRPTRRAESTGRRDEHELLPHRHVDVRRNVHLQSAAATERFLQLAHSFCQPAVELPERDPRVRAQVADQPGSGDERLHPRQAAKDGVGAEGIRQHRRRLHPVQDGNHRGLGTDHASHSGGSVGELPGLGGDDNRIDRPDLRRIVRRPCRLDVDVACDAL
jgi:hypothetical protein